MESKIKLLMTFKDSEGKRVSISVDSPREDLTGEEIHEVMNFIIEKDVFSPNGGKFESLLEAKVVETSTTVHDLVI